MSLVTLLIILMHPRNNLSYFMAIYQFPQNYKLNSALIIIRNVSYYYDFWRSCDTEDWSNDAENTEINYSLTHIHIDTADLHSNNI